MSDHVLAVFILALAAYTIILMWKGHPEPPAPSFTCPECGTVTTHPQDVENDYCPRCHAFTEDLHSWLRAVKVEHDHGDLTDDEYRAELEFFRDRYLGLPTPR